MLQKQELDLSFQLGLDQKTDKFRIKPGNFLSLSNSVFDTIGRLTKRNGFGQLTTLSDTPDSIATYNGGLIALGTSLQSLAARSSQWVDKGFIKQVSLDVIPAVRTNTSQTFCDMAVASNDLACVIMATTQPASNGTSSTLYQYSIIDITTGETIVTPTTLTVTLGTITYAPKVFLLGSYFIVVFNNNIASTYHLQYKAINTSTLVVGTEVDISTNSTPYSTGSFDAVSINNSLYFAWNGSDLGNAIRMAYLTSTLTMSSEVIIGTGQIANYMSVTADATTPSAIIWVGFNDTAASAIYSIAVDPLLNSVAAQASVTTSITATSITCTAQDSSVTYFYDVYANYVYDTSISRHRMYSRSRTSAGTVGSATVIARAIGLASKSFIIDGTAYMVGVYSSPYQPTYFLMDSSGNIIGKLAYSNAGQGYADQGLFNVTVSDTEAYFPYLFRTTVQAVNKTQGAANAGAVYVQTGINVAKYDFDPEFTQTAEIGGSLQLSGGIVWQYDGAKPVELGFFVYPDFVEASSPANPTPTGDTTNTSTTISNVSSTTDLVVGMNISGTGIPASTTITNISGTTITISNAATATNVGTTLTFTGNVSNQQYYYQCTYEWTDNAGNVHRSAPSIPVTVTTSGSGAYNKIYVPCLNLTYKTVNPIRIVIYRWSAAQQNYYQVQSVSAPTLNILTTDSITYVDIKADSEILGNTLLYTTGGVLENIAPPASNIMALIGSRMMLVSAEDPNLIWFSKQVIESTPVEFSDQLTKFIPPTLSAQTSTGPIKALSVMDDKWMIFKDNAIYYIAGEGPDNTGANDQYSEPQFITSVVGCDNPNSIAMTPDGLMFQSNKGIWILKRDLSTSYIGAPVETLALAGSVVNTLNIPNTNQIRFMMDTGIALMYDYYVGQWGTFSNVSSLSNVLYQDLHTYVNSFGLILQETPDLYLDNSTPVLMSFTTSWISLAGVQGFERFYFAHLLGEYKTPFNLDLSFAYDYNDSSLNTIRVSPVAPASAYGVDPFYGSGTPYGGPPSAFKARVFPSKQKCETFQVTVQEVYDPSYSITAGAGLTLSSLQLTVGLKRGTRTSSAARSFGS